MAADFWKIKDGITFVGRSSPPSDPQNGDTYYDTSLNKFRAYENNAWVDIINASSSVDGFLKIRLLDTINTTLPIDSVTIDGKTVVHDDKVLFTELSSGNNRVYRATVSGGLVTSWAVQADFVGSNDPTDGSAIYIKEGDIYADQDLRFDGTSWFSTFNHKVELTLINNTTNGIVFQVPHATYKHFVVEYSVSRGSAFKTGTLHIATDGTSTGIVDTNAEVGTTGVTFDASVSGSLVRLTYTTTNTGSSATLKRTARVW